MSREQSGGTSTGTASGDDGEGNDGQVDQEDILRAQIRQGLSELNRPRDGLFLSALSAGLDIGFGPLLMAVVLTAAEFSFSSPLTKDFLMANAYAFGFILVVMGRSELFTEHTTLAVLPVLDRQATVGQLGRLWGIVYLGNLVGGTVFAGSVIWIAPALGVAEPRAFVEIGTALTEHPTWVLLAAGVLAGWLMGLLSWLVAAAQESVSRILFVWIIATAIGFAHLPHSIAGTVEVLAGVFVGPEVTLRDFARFLVASTLGNAIGGSVFVALLKYGHVVRTGPPEGRINVG
jgi:formate/nitrite transporter FocA (FNT family)